MLVQDFLTRSARRIPEKTALVAGGCRVSYAALDAMTNRLANALLEAGVSRGDRVAVCLPNGVAAVAAMFGALKAGAAFVPLNPGIKLDALGYIVNNCRAVALFLDRRKAAMVPALRERAPALRRVVLSGDGFGEQAGAEPPPRVNIDLDLACLIYTSGSTGDPKGVMSDHSNMVFAASSIVEYLGNTPDDIILSVLPLSFDYGLYQALMTFLFGGTLVLEEAFAYPVEIVKRMAEERVTGFPGVPTMFARLMPLDLSGFDLSSLRYITNTAAALPVSHIGALRLKFPGVKIFSMYGLTETKRTLYLPPEQLEKRPGSVGIAIPGTEVWIEDAQGNRAGPNEIGELVVRGRHVMRGYWEAPEATERRFRPGPIPGERLCYTGDLFRMDEEGYMYFVGRTDDIIKSRGEKVAPKEVENVLYALEGVVEAAVIGVDDPVLGQAIKAVLATNRRGMTRNEVLAHCRAHLEDFKIPKYVEFRDELPKNNSGKIAKRELA